MFFFIVVVMNWTIRFKTFKSFEKKQSNLCNKENKLLHTLIKYSFTVYIKKKNVYNQNSKRTLKETLGILKNVLCYS